MTRIRRLEVYEVKLKLEEPFTISSGTSTYSHNVVVKFVDEDGRTGWGEGSPSYRVSRETVGSNIEAIKSVAGKIIGLDILKLERLREILAKIEGNPSAKTALETAFLDLMGKELQKPIYRFMGGYRDSIVTDFTISIRSPEEMAKNALKAVEKGFKILKIKLGVSPEEDVERIKRIREAVGPDVKIRVDANQGWKFDDAVYVLNKIADYDVELCEQPLEAGDLKGHARLRKESPIPIMLDESVHGVVEAVKAIEMEAVDFINIKLMKTKGVSEAVTLAHLAESYGIPCMVGCMGESRIGISMGVHFAQAIKNVMLVDLDADLLQAEFLVEKGGASIAPGGIRRVPEVPGLGVEKVNETKLIRRFTVGGGVEL